LLRGLHALEFDRDANDRPVPIILQFTPAARQQFIQFFGEWAEKQYHAQGDPAAAFSKLEGYTIRFALIHHCALRATRDPADPLDRTPVTKESLEAGIGLARWFADECERVYQMLSETEEEANCRLLVEYLRARGGRITVRELQRSNSSKYPTSDDARAALEELERAGEGYWEDPPATPRGGNPARWFVLHPTPDTSDTCSESSCPDDDGPPDTTSDTTSPSASPLAENPNKHATFSGNGEQVSEVSGVGQGEVTQTTPAEPPGKGTATGEQVSGRATIQPPPQPLSPSFQVVSDPAGLSAVAAALDNTARVGLDVETTGLDPRTDRIRLLSLACDTIDGGTFVYLVDCFDVDPSPLWEALAAKELVIHNAAFDLRFLALLGLTPSGPIHDTMLLARLLAAGTNDRCRLDDCCARYLGRTLDKAAQRSDWSAGELAAEQLAYAAADVEVLVLLYQTLTEKIKAADLERVAGIEDRALPAFVWLARSGVAFDRQAWDALTKEAQAAAQQLATQLDAAARKGRGF
jgi:DNA polymerase III epsilon subunit-like protein